MNKIIKFEDSVENDILMSDFGIMLLDKYQLLNKIYESNVNQIFVIRDYVTKQLYILKAINKNHSHSWDLDAIKKIDHPQIAHIVDVQTTEKYIYILKEYIKGITLEEYINKFGPLSEETVLEIGLELCGILEYFHSLEPSPIIYRDLKPANLIISEGGEIRLIDLDSVRQYKGDSQKDTFYIGTEGFASPEQFGFSQTDNRTDIYTLGTTLYYLFTGKKPESDRFRIKSIKIIRNDVSDAMSEIIDKCTSFNPDNRYQNVNALRNDLLKLYNKNIFLIAKQKMKKVFRQKKFYAVAMVIIITVATMLYFVALYNNKNGGVAMAQDSASMESNATLTNSQNSKSNTSNEANTDSQYNMDSFSFDRTTILEAFWSGDIPQSLPIEFVQYYKQQDSHNYNQSTFFIGIKEWDLSKDYEQMQYRINQVGGKLVLHAEGYKDVQIEMNGDSMTSGDGNWQIYVAYVRNDKDLVSGVKYKIVDTTGHWVVNNDVTVERKENLQKETSFSYDKTTINEAFWSGDVPEKLPSEFAVFYKLQDIYRFDPNVFFIAINEWDSTKDYSQMAERLSEVGSRLQLRAHGYKDVEIELNGHTITVGNGLAQVYFVNIINGNDFVSGVKYKIVDTTGHWIINDDVFVKRPKK